MSDIVEVLVHYMTLNPAGRNFKGMCPFCKDKHPTFLVSTRSQRWRCFGDCNVGGDADEFVRRIGK